MGGGPGPRVRDEAGRGHLHGGPRRGRGNTLHCGEDEGGERGRAGGAGGAEAHEDAQSRDHHCRMQSEKK